MGSQLESPHIQFETAARYAPREIMDPANESGSIVFCCIISVCTLREITILKSGAVKLWILPKTVSDRNAGLVDQIHPFGDLVENSFRH